MAKGRPYDLWYWAEIPGRGEFIRLALEAGGIPYRDRAQEEGSDGLEKDMATREAVFAPPYLIAGRRCIAQTANILLWLGEKHGLAPKSDAGRLLAHQLQLTMLDVLDQAHNIHHPISGSLYYEDQKAEAERAAKPFREERIAQFLGYFEAVLEESKGDWLLGKSWSYADLSLFQLAEGLSYAFPKRMKTLAKRFPKVMALRDRVAVLPALADYLASDRRIPFNEDGIFRHYPELDGR